MTFLSQSLLLQLKSLNGLQKPKRKGALGIHADLGGGWGSETRPLLLLVCKRPGAKLVACLAVFPLGARALVAVGVTDLIAPQVSPPIHSPTSALSHAAPPLGYASSVNASEGYRIWNGAPIKLHGLKAIV